MSCNQVNAWQFPHNFTTNQRHYDVITNKGNSEILKRHLSHYSYIALYVVVSLSLFKYIEKYCMTLRNGHIYLAYFWAMTSFLKGLAHAKNTDNHCWSAVLQYFEYMVPKTFYSCLLCLRSKKIISFQVFSILFQEKCWPQQQL